MPPRPRGTVNHSRCECPGGRGRSSGGLELDRSSSLALASLTSPLLSRSSADAVGSALAAGYARHLYDGSPLAITQAGPYGDTVIGPRDALSGTGCPNTDGRTLMLWLVTTRSSSAPAAPSQRRCDRPALCPLPHARTYCSKTSMRPRRASIAASRFWLELSSRPMFASTRPATVSDGGRKWEPRETLPRPQQRTRQGGSVKVESCSQRVHDAGWGHRNAGRERNPKERPPGRRPPPRPPPSPRPPDAVQAHFFRY